MNLFNAIHLSDLPEADVANIAASLERAGEVDWDLALDEVVDALGANAAKELLGRVLHWTSPDEAVRLPILHSVINASTCAAVEIDAEPLDRNADGYGGGLKVNSICIHGTVVEGDYLTPIGLQEACDWLHRGRVSAPALEVELRPRGIA